MKPLLAACPQPPVSKRLPLLEGAWQQVWGPYSYKNNEKRGVDPAVDPQHIYQVVFKDGSYSNVAPLRNSKGQPQRATILLQGQYQPDKDPLQPNLLHVRFVGLGQVKGSPPAGFASYPAVAKARHEGTLAGYHKVLPNWFVRWVFGGGQLTEVYTDADLRLTYGASKKHPRQRYLYILKRVN